MKLFMNMPKYTMEDLESMQNRVSQISIGEDLPNFRTEDCKEEGIAFAKSLSEQIISNGFTLPRQLLAKHSVLLSCVHDYELTYSTVLSVFNCTGLFDFIHSRIQITGIITAS